MLPSPKDAVGRLFTTLAAVNSQSTFMGGIALSSAGALHISSAAPSNFTNSFGVTATGQLCTVAGGAIDHFTGGLPFTANGALVIQVGNTPAANDPFVGGVRVGALGGVYTVNADPP